MPFNRLVLFAVILCTFLAAVRADSSCEGQTHLDPCPDDSSEKVCIKTEETDSTGVNCEMDCVKLCDHGASVGQDCSGEHGATKTCQNVCDCQDPPSCELVCKPSGAVKKGLKKKKKAAKKKKTAKKKKAAVKKGK